jgi:hypothetical protein
MTAKETLSKIDDMALDHDSCDYGLPLCNDVWNNKAIQIIKDYARLQIEKDRERVKAKCKVALIGNADVINLVPIILD